ncbi:hypothetical protein M5X00_26440 [Paenibacillus alvei]|nr:hypothetical protein [Paenibacillus alvei]EJW14057.1 hypothetical protein PAV_141p01630 [Paenibacillus alvei DSM 29]MCY9544890.1 hypothetical protein [Paenibacillus alvei]MCY9707791.1 hypothetical protein [Paenibacillus alvei]MCY9757772.1 hypothetical protein [Paenibacillus alvei]MEC0082697.1 hypothetical protein [Paenibacillus alvei]
MRNFKHKVDVYFDLDGNIEGQFLYYGAIGTMAFSMIVGTIGGIFS